MMTTQFLDLPDLSATPFVGQLDLFKGLKQFNAKPEIAKNTSTPRKPPCIGSPE